MRLSEVFHTVASIRVSSSQHYLFFSVCNRCSSVSLEWHWTEPLRIDWSTTCAHVCQPWIICNDIRSISRGLAVCIHCGKWTAQSKEALEKLVITRGRALTQNTVLPAALNGKSGCIPGELSACFGPAHSAPSSLSCLIEPCFTQKAMLSLLGDRHLWQHLPLWAPWSQLA